MQPYSAQFAQRNLQPQTEDLKIGKHRYRVDIRSDQRCVIERGPEGERKLGIAHVLGGKNVYYFLTPGERGRLQTLPVAYDVRREEWFDTASSGMRHFPGGDEEEVLHWTDREYTFNTSCYSCHVSQLSTNYDLKSDTYNTIWAEPGINCETCHGPGVEHARVCSSAEEGKPPADLKITTVTQSRGFTAHQVDATCVPCHAQMVPLTTLFRPGERYFDHYDLVTLEDADYYPDGRDLGENYTYTSWLMSPCVKAGKLDCVHCHTSSGRFRFAEDPNRSCLPCHAKRVENVLAHSHHPAESTGTRCIGCHMPKTEFARMTRSDHSMLPPTPAATIAFKSPNACNICHNDKDAAWADQEVRKWHADDYQRPILERAGLIAAARKGNWARLPVMLAYIVDPKRDEVFAASLLRLLRPCEDDAKWPVIIQALDDRSPLVRAASVEALSGYITPKSMSPLLKATRDEYRLVRVRAAAALAAVPRDWLNDDQQKNLAAATAEFVSAMRARPDDHASHYNLGNFYSERRKYEKAISYYQSATELQPNDIAPRVNASLVYNAQGRNDLAEKSLREALRIDPASVPANLNLGLLLAELGRDSEAESALRKAFEADPQNEVAAYNICVLRAQRDLAEAIEWCGRANVLRPNDSKYAYTLAFYLHANGNNNGAIPLLEGILERQPASGDAYALLGEVYERGGMRDNAIAVYRRAADNERLPAQERYHFSQVAQALENR
ncbi:MAG: tetratricopeptide repeat protein [Phycisphaerales bacterium]|nr:MAG: tetratricopeptide repeat protein [Phycisphaerales bacterium]